MYKLRVLILSCVIAFGIGLSKDSYGVIITNQIGVDSIDGIGSLTGGFIATPGEGGAFSWTHTYPAFTGTIDWATLRLDTIDMDSDHEKIYDVLKIGSTTIGSNLGAGPAGNAGRPGPWRPLGDPYNVDNLLPLPSSLYSVLKTGTIQLDLIQYGPVLNTNWGSNRSLLTINYSTPDASTTTPEPSTMLLLGIGLAGLVGASARRKWKKKAVDKG